MRKSELFGMEEMSSEFRHTASYRNIRDRIVTALFIDSSAHDWMIYRGEMHADLMRASRLDLNNEEREYI